MLSGEILNNIKNQNFCRIRGDIKLDLSGALQNEK